MNIHTTSMATIRDMDWFFTPEETEAERLRRAQEKQVIDDQACSFGPHRNRHELERHWHSTTRKAYGDER